MQSSLPAFVDEVPDYAVKDGRMHVSMGSFILVMPVHIFLEGRDRADAAIAKWHLGELGCDRRVIPIKAR